MKLQTKLIIAFLIIIFSIATFANLYPENQNHKPSICTNKQVLGEAEKISLIKYNLVLDAKLDTGAAMSSISAKKIQVFDKNNKQWVQFIIYDKSSRKNITIIKPLIRYAYIIKRPEELSNINSKTYSKRPVISLLVCLGDQKKIILFNLADRAPFKYPVLLGKNALVAFKVIVDSEKKYTLRLNCRK